MIVLILIFVILFAFSCAALAITNDQEHRLLLNGWDGLDNKTKTSLERHGDCCGFDKGRRHFCHSQIPSEVYIYYYRPLAVDLKTRSCI